MMNCQCQCKCKCTLWAIIAAVVVGVIAAFLARSNVDNEDIPVLCSLACEVHGYAGSIAAERFGSRGAMARDIIDALGLAEDALEEQMAFPDSGGAE